ncbi:hypothetical protein GCM10023095_05080 [Pseudaeromonas paramecii]|uniref:Uncharacterized protein n=1 Tax=Pseudaeromonas paramecii TaxID=2138166 RepID=A0ABP8PYF9_9GAMM
MADLRRLMSLCPVPRRRHCPGSLFRSAEPTQGRWSDLFEYRENNKEKWTQPQCRQGHSGKKISRLRLSPEQILSGKAQLARPGHEARPHRLTDLG